MQMNIFRLFAFAGAMVVSLNALAEGGGDRTFERAFSANAKSHGAIRGRKRQSGASGEGL
jgi:hypothetical protein